MKVRYAIFGILLATVSLFGWRGMAMRMDLREREIAASKEKYRVGADEYCREYNEWLKLPPQEQFLKKWGGYEYGRTTTSQERQERQREKLAADLEDLASGALTPNLFAEEIYGADWQKEVDGYITEKQLNQQMAIVAKIGIGLGGLLFLGSMLGALILAVKELWKRPKKKSPPKSKRAPVYKNDLPFPAVAVEPPSTKVQVKKASEPERGPIRIFQGSESAPGEWTDRWTYEQVAPVPVKPPGWHREDSSTAILPNVEPAFEAERVSAPATKVMEEGGGSLAGAEVSVSEAGSPSAGIDLTEDNLSKLTQEVAALREYAAAQQDRVRKLQDGYDWNILKNFCQRIIRCIDNLNVRIGQEQQAEEIVQLEEVRDELIFALESSGIEQFEPELYTEYRGQEKRLEVLRDRVECDHPQWADTIAEIVRCGYQYVIDEHNIKIVRTAQVRLYQVKACVGA